MQLRSIVCVCVCVCVCVLIVYTANEFLCCASADSLQSVDVQELWGVSADSLISLCLCVSRSGTPEV